MFTIISSEQFKQVPWKNGKGITTELVVKQNESSSEFLWRISIAPMNTSGTFSDFSGYMRHLVLLKGNHLELNHHENGVQKLTSPLSVASFDGANTTFGLLNFGSVQNFNVMVRKENYKAHVHTYHSETSLKLKGTADTFLFSPTHPLQITTSDRSYQLNEGDLAHASEALHVVGKHFIVVEISHQNSIKS